MRFNTLDGLRGFAAILVLFFHLGPQAPIDAAAGYLAVDLFFALSGFVIAHAYEPRLRAGLPLREFVVRRLIRVYPMALVGAAIGVLLSGRYLWSLLLVPHFGGLGPLYPNNVALWSLALELVVNLAYGLVATRIGWRGLTCIAAVSGAVLIRGAFEYQYGGIGPFWNSFGYGVARTVFFFTLGVVMYRLHTRFAVRRRETRLAWLLPLALVLLLTQMPANRNEWILTAAFVLLPAILWLGTIWEASGNRLFAEMGGLSYPLYCIHLAVIHAYDGVAEPPAYLWIVLVAAAWWLNSRVDEPIRRAIVNGRHKRSHRLAAA